MLIMYLQQASEGSLPIARPAGESLAAVHQASPALAPHPLPYLVAGPVTYMSSSARKHCHGSLKYVRSLRKSFRQSECMLRGQAGAECASWHPSLRSLQQLAAARPHACRSTLLCPCHWSLSRFTLCLLCQVRQLLLWYPSQMQLPIHMYTLAHQTSQFQPVLQRCSC